MEISGAVTGISRENCYFCQSGEELAIIDPGENAHFILQELSRHSKKPAKIILTHYHFDHVSAVPGILKELGEIPVLCHKADAKRLEFPVNVCLEDRDRIKVGEEEMKVLHTPGHSAGSISLLGDGYIFTGDTVFRDGYGRTDFEDGSEADMQRSLKQLSVVFRAGLIVYPGHGEAFKI